MCIRDRSTVTRWVWSILPPTMRCLYHWPANEVDSAWDDQSLTFTQKRSLSHPLWNLRGNLRTPYMARWKARGRLYIRRNWTFLAISYGWDVMSGNLSKSAFFERGGSVWAQISEGRGHRSLTTVGVRVAEWLTFVGYQNICSASLSFVTIHACDRRTDRLPRPPSHMLAR